MAKMAKSNSSESVSNYKKGALKSTASSKSIKKAKKPNSERHSPMQLNLVTIGGRPALRGARGRVVRPAVPDRLVPADDRSGNSSSYIHLSSGSVSSGGASTVSRKEDNRRPKASVDGANNYKKKKHSK